MSGRFAAAAREAVRRLAPAQIDVLAAAIERGLPAGAVADALPLPAYQEVAAAVAAARQAEGVPLGRAAAHLRALAEGYALGRAEQRVECVWSGPASSHVPARATARVLIELVAAARRELVMMTYAARPYPPLAEALEAAQRRGVAISVVVETLAGAGGGLQGEEPAAAFLAVPGIEIWHWPVARRGEPGARMHAKLAVADRETLLVTSANLTQAGVGGNIEAGLLVHGGTAPVRVAEHVRALQASGALARLR